MDGKEMDLRIAEWCEPREKPLDPILPKTALIESVIVTPKRAWMRHRGSGGRSSWIPEVFSKNLHAMHVAEAELIKRGLWSRYEQFLKHTVPITQPLAHATAAQRAEALCALIQEQEAGCGL